MPIFTTVNQTAQAKSANLSWWHNSTVRFALFWLLIFAVVMVISTEIQIMSLRVVCAFIVTSFYVGIVYINYELLIPHLRRSKNFLMYCLMLLAVAMLLTPLKTLLIYVSYRLSDISLSLWDTNYLDNFLALGIVGFVSSVAKILGDWLQQQRTMSELETQKASSELKFLKSQINPHFLFNTLNNLYALTLKKSDDAPEVVIKLSDMMRYMLYECNEPLVPLQKEVDYINNYIALESLRQSSGVDIAFELTGSPGALKIAPLIFVPFLENAFKHGLKENIKEGFLHISIEIIEHRLKFELQNSKPTRITSPSQQRKRAGGIGLENVRRRLELIYPERHQLEIEDSPDRYLTSLNLILTEDKQD